MNAKIVVKSIIFNKHLNRILLLQRSNNDPTGANTWENAGGKIEFGEKPEGAIKREIREETGITDITIKKIAYVSIIYGDKPDLIIVYICETQTETITLSPEHQAFIWADREECKRLLPTAIIDDFEKSNIFEIYENYSDTIPKAW